MMPIVAICVYCSHKIEEKEKSVNAPGGVAHLACAQKVAIRTRPAKLTLAGVSRFRRIPVSMGRVRLDSPAAVLTETSHEMSSADRRRRDEQA
jgi:hypothetical protein